MDGETRRARGAMAVGPVRYGQVVEAMGAARGAGVERIGIMGTDRPQ